MMMMGSGPIFIPCRRMLARILRWDEVGCDWVQVLRCLEVVLFPVASGIGACLFVRTTLLLLLLLLFFFVQTSQLCVLSRG